MSFVLEWKGSDIVVKFSGVVSYNEIDEADSIVYGNERFDQMKYQIFDFTDIKEFVMNDQEMKMIAALDKASSRWNNNVKVAIITNNEKIVKLTEVYKKVMESSNWETRIFEYMKDGMKWCNAAI